MATLVTGQSFSPGDEVTAAKMNAQVNNATISGILRGELASSIKVINISASAPTSPTAGEMWWDSTNMALKFYTGTQWLAVGPYQAISLTCQSNANAGDVVILDTGSANSVDTTTTASLTSVVGVLQDAVTGAPASSVVIIEGVATVNVTGTTAIGDYLYTSTTVGKASPSATLADGAFARALTADSGGQVSAILFSQTPLDVPILVAGENEATYSSFSVTGASVTNNTWYDIPDGVNGSTISTTGTDAMNVTFTTNTDNQKVTFICKNLLFEITTTAIPDGIRFLFASTEIARAQWVAQLDGNFPSAAGDIATLGFAVWSIETGTGDQMIYVPYVEVTFNVATAGSYGIRAQMLASATGSLSLVNAGETASLRVVKSEIQ